ncbi:MAG TPA: phosphoethanolamine transferase [Xanthomonadaceae bacterium]|jgi:glucan phosphoethanolaminetransferase (alkaline phosphatase superfamily)
MTNIPDPTDRPSSAHPRRAAFGAILLLLALLLLPDIVWLHFEHGNIRIWISALLIPAALLALLFAVFGNRPWIACLLLAPFAALAPLEAFYIGRYHHPTTPEILATLIATNPREAREYLGNDLPLLALCLVAALALPLLAAWWSRRSGLRWRHDSRNWVLAILITMPPIGGIVSASRAGGDLGTRFRNGVQSVASLADFIPNGFPFGVPHRFIEYRRQWAAMRTNVARLAAYRFHARRIANPGRRQVYVLVIGEASRRDHWQIFGYPRPTNPELSRVRNLVPIPDMDSSWPVSLTAIPMILTRKPPTDMSIAWHEASILRTMEESGYDTWWISNQMPIGRFDSPVSTFGFEARHADFRNHASWVSAGAYDEDLLPPLRSALHDSKGDLFIVLHLMGSHHGYDFRYPESYRRFKPTADDATSTASLQERTRNSYDNTILYTDHVLSQVIDILDRSGAVTALWYESDHGEALPTATCTLEEHGNGTRYEYEISAFFWASDAYAAAFPARMAALHSNAGKRTMSADTFESLIDMAGLSYPGRDPSLSLFDPGWRYHPRIVNQPWQVNIDEAMISRNCQLALPPSH